MLFYLYICISGSSCALPQYIICNCNLLILVYQVHIAEGALEATQEELHEQKLDYIILVNAQETI